MQRQTSFSQARPSRDSNVGHMNETSRSASKSRQVDQWPLSWNDVAGSSLENLSLKRKHDDGESADMVDSQMAPVRRRISRACDKCNQLRTKV
jgi:hypothetical protein